MSEKNNFTKKTMMKQIVLILLSVGLIQTLSYSQKKNESVKNCILMVPDGTSASILNFTRWYNDNKPLSFDSLLCGFVRTHSLDDKITDSAPAATAMATSQKSGSGFIGMSLDSVPLITVLELAKIQGKATGIVVSCEHPHATPAAFTSHAAKRSNYETINEQQVYNHLDVVFSGGGNDFLNNGKYSKKEKKNIKRKDEENLRDTLIKSLNYNFISTTDKFNSLNEKSKVWASFDTDTSFLLNHFDNLTLKKHPTLAEMTDKAIKILFQNKNGFFLLVEGSKIDWAAHMNDPLGVISEFSGFEEAAKVALDFAVKDKNTAVIICPDHGTGGIAIGSKNTNKNYDDTKYASFTNPLKKVKHTPEYTSTTLKKMLQKNHSDTTKIRDILSIHLNLILSPAELKKIYAMNPADNGYEDNLYYELANLLNLRTGIGWTTYGHTGEDVFLAMYHPKNYILKGVIDNTDIAKYIARILNLDDFKESTKKYFAPHTEVFQGLTISIHNIDTNPELIVSDGKKTLRAKSNKNYITLSDNITTKKIELKTVIVFSKNTFYLPVNLRQVF
ncbi:MAG: hypothetical protein A2275_13135 [Bacteroidetes bacterium RIFOXYA12_FULL_35_11]|nr:MAG: hypothetical protein A2X01_09935 [Bacteroidetes bacterium GWF2_35_48]OFY73175.1 MAG: hypothetical protein A2275_13135 [Bacteroidetes bacterium RIFOXYA12_FULL_35_11]OFZ01270.1 MAG: hypothetical protein A2491_13890 [Bacteroidetes bacterium RIFOXYC12_FULL_35_7]HBX50925.1 alkaline phosphatase [Bacteroidales bacterium]